MKKIQELIKTTKGKIIAWGLSFIIAGGGYILSQVPPSAEKILDKYTRLEQQKVGLGSEYLNQFDGKGFFGKLEVKRLEEMVSIVEKNIKELESSMPKAEIVKVELNRDYGSQYYDVDTTIKNVGSKNIRYIKLNIYYKDSSGNIVKSDWTNDNAIIKPGATQTISKMAKKSSEWDNVTVEVAEVKY